MRLSHVVVAVNSAGGSSPSQAGQYALKWTPVASTATAELNAYRVVVDPIVRATVLCNAADFSDSTLLPADAAALSQELKSGLMGAQPNTSTRVWR